MQHDEVIWQLIMHGHCSFRAKTKTQNFCRNENNVTGLCNRSSCPLANSRYATIKEEGGRCYLYVKTIERAHTPKNMWQRIRLKRQYAAALAQVDEHLAHWPKFLVHKNKQRLTKITQYLIRMRRLAVKARPKLVTMPARKEKQLKRKEAKAETAAQLEKSIERELLARLQSGTYGDIYNFPLKQYEKVLNREELEEEEEEGAERAAAEAEEEEEEEVDEYVEGDEESEEEESEGEEEVEWVDDAEVDFSDDEEDLEDFSGEGSEEDEGGSEDEAAAAAADSEGEDGDEDAGPSGSRPAGGKPAGGAAAAAAGGKRKGAAAEAKPDAGGKRGAKPEAKRRRRGRMEIEYEEEREDLRSTR